ncbi:MAG: hypothetical protein ACKOEC_06840 [Acidimicrobiia bacterium]
MRCLTGLFALMFAVTAAYGQSAPPDAAAIQQFQRAADSYAFAHRQADRRPTVPRRVAEGVLFTPQVSAVLRERIAAAVKAGCPAPEPRPDSFAVPSVGASMADTQPLDPCVSARLPKLPEELDYRAAGAAMLLVDTHLQMVVDVLHAAFPRRDN